MPVGDAEPSLPLAAGALLAPSQTDPRRLSATVEEGCIESAVLEMRLIGGQRWEYVEGRAEQRAVSALAPDDRLPAGDYEVRFRVTDCAGNEGLVTQFADGSAGLVTLHPGEMTAADQAPGGPFGVVLASLNSLLHLDTPEAQRAALAAARRALDPRGQLLIDIMNPTPDTLRGLDGALVHEGGWSREDGSRIDKFSARRIDTSEQTISTDLWYDVSAADGAVRRVATRYRMRYLHRAELELLLELAGFASWELYGSYDLDPYDVHSDRLIVAAEAS